MSYDKMRQALEENRMLLATPSEMSTADSISFNLNTALLCLADAVESDHATHVDGEEPRKEVLRDPHLVVESRSVVFLSS